MSDTNYSWDTFLILISTCITLLGTYFITQKQWNREDTRKIKEKIIPVLKESLKTPMEHLNRNHIIGFSDKHRPFCYPKEKWFLDWFSNLPPFMIKNDELIFSYNKDKNLKKHIDNILCSFKEYKNTVLQLKERLTTLNPYNIPETFKTDIQQLLIETSEFRWFDGEDGDHLTFRLYVSLLVGVLDDFSTVNKEPYNGRNRHLRVWEEVNSEKLQNIIQKYPVAFEIQKQIRRDINDIKFYLGSVQDEVNALDHEL